MIRLETVRIESTDDGYDFVNGEEVFRMKTGRPPTYRVELDIRTDDTAFIARLMAYFESAGADMNGENIAGNPEIPTREPKRLRG